MNVVRENTNTRKACQRKKKNKTARAVKRGNITAIIQTSLEKVNTSRFPFVLYTKNYQANTDLFWTDSISSQPKPYEYRLYHHSWKPKNRIRQPPPQTNPEWGIIRHHSKTKTSTLNKDTFQYCKNSWLEMCSTRTAVRPSPSFKQKSKTLPTVLSHPR